jgi:hypothetical protein
MKQVASKVGYVLQSCLPGYTSVKCFTLFFLGLFFDPEDEGEMLLRIFG